MENRIDFTTGKIVGPLLRFAGPVFLALFLQAMYGAVDLMIVGKFANPADISAVSTGSQIMMTVTNLIGSMCMGMTILLGQKIGEKKGAEGGQIIGSGLLLFMVSCTEQRSGKTGQGHERFQVRSDGLVPVWSVYVLYGFFSWGSSVGDIYKRQCGYPCVGRLSESIRHRLSAHLFFVLLYRIL